MAVTAKQLSSLLNETIKARQAAYVVLDYIDLVNQHGEVLATEATETGEKVKDHGNEIRNGIEILMGHIRAALNTMPVDDDEIKTAAERIVLYHGDEDEAMNWSEKEKSGHEEGSYWWRYWQAVYDALKAKKEIQ